MDYSIANHRLSVTVRSLGAELQSLRTPDGHEYLWHGDARSWNRRAPLLFPIGGHPGFACPIEPNLRFDDYRLEFEKPEHIARMMKGKKNLSSVTEPFLQGASTVPLSYDLFKRGAIILRGLASEAVRIASPRGTRSVAVSFTGFPYLGIWSSSVESDFVCIEPWHGVDSTEGDPPDIEAKQGIEHLEPGAVFGYRYTITVG